MDSTETNADEKTKINWLIKASDMLNTLENHFAGAVACSWLKANETMAGSQWLILIDPLDTAFLIATGKWFPDFHARWAEAIKIPSVERLADEISFQEAILAIQKRQAVIGEMLAHTLKHAPVTEVGQ